ncbi:MAG TPA: tRNA (adenosine(37)-N6)-dimethylallyltransferase MiaA [Patescibacteria group bacterium]|nr:tRNA (adenosine(37)-N6)-dimethylallyltransferase MiaA [Patescibacteria group bacterium]
MSTPIVIVGPTASGKTDYAIKLASQSKNPVDILVVDSKQVYRGQNIVTGKDLDKFQIPKSKIQIFGVDLVDPDEQWSVAQFVEYARNVIIKSEEEDHQLLIVVGTPQYFLSLLDTPESVGVKPNQELRGVLEKLSVIDLQERLKKLNPERFQLMNNSDRNNPRRLIRAIEVTASAVIPVKASSSLIRDPVWIGLRVDKEDLEKRIRDRVIKRLEQGAIEEYKKLLEKYPNWTLEAKSALGYKELEEFVKGKIDKVGLVQLWTLHEAQYAKRQMTWWKTRSEIEWIDCYN